MDNLNIHSIASLYEAFKSAVSIQITLYLEIFHAPIHAPSAQLAEIEVGILSRQCLNQSLSSFEDM